VDRDTGLICDQTIALSGFYATKHYPGHLRRIRYRDPETGKNLVFLTNQFALLRKAHNLKGRWISPPPVTSSIRNF